MAVVCFEDFDVSRCSTSVSDNVPLSFKRGVLLGIIYVFYLLIAALLVSLRVVDVLLFNSNLMHNIYASIAAYFAIVFALCVTSLFLGVFFHKEDLQSLPELDAINDPTERDALKKALVLSRKYDNIANLISSVAVFCVIASFVVIVMQAVTFPDEVVGNKLLEVYIVAGVVSLAALLVFVSEFLYITAEKKLVNVVEPAKHSLSRQHSEDDNLTCITPTQDVQVLTCITPTQDVQVNAFCTAVQNESCVGV